jgi:hypothetical protein
MLKKHLEAWVWGAEQTEGERSYLKVVETKMRPQEDRVARWCIFKPKILIWLNFGGFWNGKGWYILQPS